MLCVPDGTRQRRVILDFPRGLPRRAYGTPRNDNEDLAQEGGGEEGVLLEETRTRREAREINLLQLMGTLCHITNVEVENLALKTAGSGEQKMLSMMHELHRWRHYVCF